MYYSNRCEKIVEGNSMLDIVREFHEDVGFDVYVEKIVDVD
jgi:hypothetical protein